MRRLTPHDRDDSGVVTLLVIGMIPILLLATAAGIDVNRFSQENSSAQHSADATALAVATDCVLSGSPQGAASYDRYRKAEQAISGDTPLVCGSGQVRIKIEKNVNGGLVLDRNARLVQKEATVSWGTLGGANTVPLVIADCEFRAPSVGETVTLYLDDPKPQSGCSSLPGGFSQLDKAGCSVPVSAGGTVDGVTGVGGLQNKVPCLTNSSGPALPHTVLIPIYNAAACQTADCKGKGPYLIDGFAAIELTGYSFNGNVYDGSLGKKCPEDKDRGKYCLQGTFVEYLDSQGTPGPSTDFGVRQIYLSS
ncbi:MAG: pilus assembly protein TadG-related protein [Ilumatobacteraceae bacterium]